MSLRFWRRIAGRYMAKQKKSEESLKGWAAIAKFLGQPISGLLLGDWALHQLGPLLPGGLNTLVQEHLANLRQNPLLIVRYALKLALEFRGNPKS